LQVVCAPNLRVRASLAGSALGNRPGGPAQWDGNANDETLSVCSARVRSNLPVSTSHSMSVLSMLPDSAVRPSHKRATEVTKSECPLNVRVERAEARRAAAPAPMLA